MAIQSKSWLGLLNRDTYALYLAYRHPQTPGFAKFLGVATLLYLFFPVDIIPDVIPILGWLDDIGIAYLLSKMAENVIPVNIMAESRTKAQRNGKKIITTIIIVMSVLFVLFVGLVVLIVNGLWNMTW